MSDNPPPITASTTVLLVCITVLVSLVVAAAAAVYVFGPAHDGSIAAILISILAPTIASMVAVIKVGGVASQVSHVAQDTNQLANGLGDAKIRSAVADVLADHMVDPHAKQQLADDRERLERQHERHQERERNSE